MSGSEKSDGGARAVAAIVLVLLALVAVVFLLARPDDAPEGRPVTVTTTGGGPTSPVVDLAPGDVTRIDPHGPARDVGARDVSGGPGAALAGPAGGVIDGRTAATAAADPVVAATGLRGRVLASDGGPVAGARVSLRGGRPDASGMTVMTLTKGADGHMELSSPGEVRFEATTDADGVFELKGLDAALRFTLVASPPKESAEDLLAARRPAPALKAGQVVDAGEVRLARAARLSGTVRDPAGRPVAEATVRLGDGDGPMLFGGGEGEPGGGIAMRKAVRVAAPPAARDGPPMGDFMTGGPGVKTDAAGRYTLTRVNPGKQTVTATKAGLRAAKRQVDVADGETKDDVDLALGEPLAVSVQVVDGEGRPIVGATVQASVGYGPGGGAAKSQKTDAQGLARIEGLSSAEVTLAAKAEGFATVVQEAKLGAGDPATPRRLMMRAGCSVTARLVRDSDGAPLTRGLAFLEPIVHGPNVDVSADGSNRPDAEGRITLEGVAPGRYRLRAQSPELAATEVACEVPVNVRTVDLGDVRLGALAGLDVVVLDPDGAPVEGATVDAGKGMGGGVMIAVSTDDAAPAMPGMGRSARSGADGRARLEGLQPGNVTVRASKPPFADGTAVVGVKAGVRAEVQVKLARPGRVEGRVLGLEPGARLRVTLLRRGSPMPVASADVAADGTFAFERVAPGEYGLSTGGHGAPPPAWFTLAEGETVTRTLEAAATATVEGVVTDANGAPVAGATIAIGWLDAWHPGDSQVRFPQVRGTTQRGGHYRLTGVKPQPGLGLTVTTQAGHVSYRVDVPTAATVRRDVRLPASGAGATVRVRVTTPDQPDGMTTGATVTLERQDDRPYVRREATTGPDGVASLEAVSAGRYTVSAVATGFARARATLDLGGSGGTAVDGPTLALTPGGALLLEVTGSGSGEARIMVRPEGSTIASDVWFTGVELGGRARIDGLEVGARYEVQVSAQGHREARVVVSCDRPDPQAPVVVALQPGS